MSGATRVVNSITGNKDVDYNILLSLDDIDMENICHASSMIRLLCHNLWYRKVLISYPTFPYMDIKYRELYYKLKYNKWTDVIVYAEYMNNDILINWIINQENYNQYVKSTILKFLKNINNHRLHNKLILITNLYTFIHNHKRWLFMDKAFKNTTIERLHYLINEIPNYAELYMLYIDSL